MVREVEEALAQCNAIDITDLTFQGRSDVGAPWIQGYHSTTIYFHVMPPNGRSCMYPPGRIGTSCPGPARPPTCRSGRATCW